MMRMTMRMRMMMMMMKMKMRRRRIMSYAPHPETKYLQLTEHWQPSYYGFTS